MPVATSTATTTIIFIEIDILMKGAQKRERERERERTYFQSVSSDKNIEKDVDRKKFITTKTSTFEKN